MQKTIEQVNFFTKEIVYPLIAKIEFGGQPLCAHCNKKADNLCFVIGKTESQVLHLESDCIKALTKDDNDLINFIIWRLSSYGEDKDIGTVMFKPKGDVQLSKLHQLCFDNNSPYDLEMDVTLDESEFVNLIDGVFAKMFTQCPVCKNVDPRFCEFMLVIDKDDRRGIFHTYECADLDPNLKINNIYTFKRTVIGVNVYKITAPTYGEALYYLKE